MAPSQKLLIPNLLILAAVVGLLQATSSWAWMIHVNITNSLETKEEMLVRCKDKNTDFGFLIVPPGAQYVFGFNPTLSSDYYCSFTFQGVLHWFDIYLNKRDWKRCGHSRVCNWFIEEDGPCYDDLTTDCYYWNRKQLTD